jgi:hypothetical protein
MSTTAAKSRSPSLEAQLDHLLVSRWTAARWAHRIRSAAELPPRLQHCVRHLARGTVWLAYADAHRVYCALGRVPARMAPGPAGPLLEAYFLDGDATLLARGVWNTAAADEPGSPPLP